MTVQFCRNEFISFYDPTIEQLYRKQLNVNGKTVMAEILDTAGQDEYSSMLEHYIRNGEGYIIVYSIDNRGSFESLQYFRDAIIRVQDKEKFPLVIAGNKCDLVEQREVSTSEGQQLAKEWGCPFIETSAKDANLTDQLFRTAIKEVLNEFELLNPTIKKKRICVLL